jgi:hypothetical protein
VTPHSASAPELAHGLLSSSAFLLGFSAVIRYYAWHQKISTGYGHHAAPLGSCSNAAMRSCWMLALFLSISVTSLLLPALSHADVLKPKVVLVAMFEPGDDKERNSAYLPALEAAYQVGSQVARELIAS